MKNLYKIFIHTDLHVKNFPYIFKFNNEIINYNDYFRYILAENEEEAVKKYKKIFPDPEEFFINPFIFFGCFFNKKWTGKDTDKFQIKCEKLDINKINISNCFKNMSNEDIADLIGIFNRNKS